MNLTDSPNLQIEQFREGHYGYAQILERSFRDRYKYAAFKGVWMRFDGLRWVECPEEYVLKKAADTLYNFYHFQLASNRDNKSVKYLSAKLNAVTNPSNVMAALTFLKGFDGFIVKSQDLNKDPWLLNVLNGTLDLRTFELKPHNPKDLITHIVQAEYDPTADCPKWKQFINYVLPNPDLQRQVQRDLGVSLVGEILDEFLPIWYGSGANGKTTMIKVLMQLLDGYAIKAASNILIRSKYERHPTEIADLYGSRVVFAVESGEGRRLDEVRVKELTGGDRLKARFMHRDFFEFEPSFTIFQVTNHKPEIVGSDHAIWRRIRLIPWTVTIPPEDRRPQPEIIRELMAEAAGILRWILDGLQDWKTDKIWIASEVQHATSDYRDDMDRIGDFIEDMCDVKDSARINFSYLYSAYLDWARKLDLEPIGRSEFSSRLQAKGFQRKRSTGGTRQFLGIQLKKNSVFDYEIVTQ